MVVIFLSRVVIIITMLWGGCNNHVSGCNNHVMGWGGCNNHVSGCNNHFFSDAVYS